MEKLERLINLTAYLLDTRRPITLERLRVTVYADQKAEGAALKRMFERDKEELRAMGVNIEVTTDAEGSPAYTIDRDGYYLPRMELEPEELMALTMLSSMFLGSNTPFAGPAHSAVLKLNFDQDSRSWKGILPPVSVLEDPAKDRKLRAISEGMARRKTLSFPYWSMEAMEETVREVEPYALLNRRGSWYLIGRCRLREEVRWFKLDRIMGEVKVNRRRPRTPDFEVPEDFDLESESSWRGYSDGTGLEAVVRFSPRLAWMADRGPWEVRSREEVGGGWMEMVFETDDLDEFIWWVLGFGPEAKVIGPKELKDKVLERLRRTEAMHGGE